MSLWAWLFGKKSAGTRNHPSSRPVSNFVEWKESERGNLMFERDGWRITVFPDEGGPKTLWKFCAAPIDAQGEDAGEPFFSDHYFSQGDARSDALAFHSNKPLRNNTYQAERDERRREEVPGMISAEQRRLSELQARIDRGRSKKENLLRDAGKRLSQTQHYIHWCQMSGGAHNQIAELRKIEEKYKEILLTLK